MLLWLIMAENQGLLMYFYSRIENFSLQKRIEEKKIYKFSMADSLQKTDRKLQSKDFSFSKIPYSSFKSSLTVVYWNCHHITANQHITKL